MSDVSKFELFGETINVKDETARIATSTNASNITKLTSRVSALENAPAKAGFKNRNFILLGDSYGTGDTEVSTETYTPWTTRLESAINVIWIKAINGVGFTTSPNSFLSMLQEFSGDKASITDILVAGGYNDNISTISSIQTNISSFISYAKTNFPNAIVHICCIAWSNDYSKALNLGNPIEAYSYAGNIDSVAHVIPNGYFALHKQMNCFASDNYHPNDTGQINITRLLKLGLLYTSPTIMPNLTGNTIYDNGNNSTNQTLFMSVQDSSAEMFTTGTTYFQSVNKNGVGLDNPTTIGYVINNGGGQCNSPTNYGLCCQTTMFFANNQWYNCTLSLVFNPLNKRNEIRIRPLLPTGQTINIRDLVLPEICLHTLTRYC